MNLIQQAKADYLRGIGYYDTDAGWTHRDLDGECYTLEAAYEYEMEQFDLNRPVAEVVA